MYIKLQPIRTQEGWGSDEGSAATYVVSSKEHGFEGHLHVITEKNGEGFLEWCKNSTAKGYGAKISLKDLFEWMETRSNE